MYAVPELESNLESKRETKQSQHEIDGHHEVKGIEETESPLERGREERGQTLGRGKQSDEAREKNIGKRDRYGENHTFFSANRPRILL